jgi:PilZ domain
MLSRPRESAPHEYIHKRRYRRYDVDRPLTALLNWPDSPTIPIAGQCRVLSEGGAAAMLSQQLREGEVVSLELASGLRVYAAVRNQRGYLHGFEFVLVKDGQRAAIRRLCASNW